MLQKRDDKALFKAFRRAVPQPPLFAWQLGDEKIVSGRHWLGPIKADSISEEPTPPESE
jgi:hypothetical protein